jgi:hypothetical protein
MVLGKFLEDFVSDIKLERPSHSYYQISFESKGRETISRFLKTEFESDELLLMILGYLGENRVIDKNTLKDFPWLLNYLLDLGYVHNVDIDNPLIFVEIIYNSGRVELPDPVTKFFDGSKESCIDYITDLYKNN